ncbi:MAG: glutaredoxin 3 [Candidatus Puniceispirillales bacterium WSBS_2018_MAG_OTU23]
MAINVEIYTSQFCGFCTAAKGLLNARGIAFKEIDVTTDRDTRAKMVVRTEGKTSVPQIFIDGVSIGGCDDLFALDKKTGLSLSGLK